MVWKTTALSVTLLLLASETTTEAFSVHPSSLSIARNIVSPRSPPPSFPSTDTRSNNRSDTQYAIAKKSSSRMRSTDPLQTNDETEKNVEQERLLNTATRLRKEAEELEIEMKEIRTSNAANERSNPNRPPPLPPSFRNLKDSSWLITYRFAKDPPGGEESTAEKQGETTAVVPPKYYSGKVGLTFRSDGYTDILDPDSMVSSGKSTTPMSSSCAVFDKFWGWDEEESEKDGFRYVLFSADVNLDQDHRERFYFQARVDEEKSLGGGGIVLADGTVTVKRDIERTSSGGKFFWGVFDGAGILAQFRNVGGFTCRAVSVDAEP